MGSQVTGSRKETSYKLEVVKLESQNLLLVFV